MRAGVLIPTILGALVLQVLMPLVVDVILSLLLMGAAYLMGRKVGDD